jgi:hypothetical protein
VRSQRCRFFGPIILLLTLCGGAIAQDDKDVGAEDSIRTGVIRGQVVDENGQPLESVNVFIRATNQAAQPEAVTTDSDGRFQVTGLEPTLYTVSAHAPTYSEQIRQPSYYRIGDTLTLRLIKGGVITGTVTSAAGEPLVMTPVRAVLIFDLYGNKYAVNLMERTTDDRGVYRLYGLLPGTYLVSTRGGGSLNFKRGANDNELPIYAPSATRESAAEITVRSGEERSGVDIRYRTEPGHVVSGTIDGPRAPGGTFSEAGVSLVQLSNGTRSGGLGSSQPEGSRGFAVSGVGDGEYELTAFSRLGSNELAVSEARRITVKGADVAGIELITKALGSISGHLVLENSTSPQCKGKRKPLFSETLILRQDNSKEPTKDLQILFSGRQMPLDESGNVLFANLSAGQYRFDLQFLAKYWYLKTIIQPAPPVPTGSQRTASTTRSIDAARNWIRLKPGEKLSGLTFTLAEGAASLHGSIKLAEGERVPAQLFVHLVPAERDSAEDVLRYFATPVNADGTFTLGNLPPGRYGVVTRLVEDKEAQWVSKLRLPEESQLRSQLRGEANAAKTEIEVELKPCQNVTNYQLPLKAPTPSAEKQSATTP